MALRRALPPLAALAIVAVLLVGAGTRLYRIDAQSLWNDEGNSLRLAERNPSDLLDAAGRDIHPPGYYLMLNVWIALAGTSELALRFPSALAGLLTVAAAIALGRQLDGPGAGVLAGLFVALSPLAVYYGQEARMYALLGLWAALGMWALAVWLARIAAGRRAWPAALALAIVNAAGLYTHYAYPFTMLAQGVLVLAWAIGRARRGPRDAWRALAGFTALNLLALALFAPWLPTAWDQVAGWPTAADETALPERLRISLVWITYGSTAGDLAWKALIGPGLLALGGALGLARERVLTRGWRAALPLVWIAAVIGGLIASGAYRAANLKFLVPGAVAAGLVMGVGAAGWWRGRFAARTGRLARALRAALIVVVVALVVVRQARGLDALYHDAAYARDDYRAIAAWVEATALPGDAIVLDAPNQREVFSYYYDGPAPVYPLPRGLGGDDAATRAAVEALLAAHDRIFVLFWGEEERDPNRVVQATLDAGAYPVASQWYGDVRLAQYAVLAAPPAEPQRALGIRFGDHITLAGYALSAETLQPGDALGVTLFWQTDAPLDTRYKVTVQLQAPVMQLVAQHDAEPNNNRAPTTTWTPGETIVDPHGLVVPPDLAPGEYRVVVGVYDIDAPADRLPPEVANAFGQLFPLASVQVE